MPEDKNPRAAPVTMTERATPMDRVRQIQEMQRAAEAQAPQAAAPAAPPPPAAPAPAAQAPAPVFAAPEVYKAAITGERPVASDAAVYAKAQVNAGNLFGDGTKIEVTGNPWKVINFQTMATQVFEPKQPIAKYEATVPEKAVETEHGLMFQVSLKAKDGSEPTQKRAVLTDAKGNLTGVESKNPGEVQKLLGRAPELAKNVIVAAFGGQPREGATFSKVAPSKRGGYEVSVRAGGDTRSVEVNNFGQPTKGRALAMIDVAQYHLDKFEAA